MSPADPGKAAVYAAEDRLGRWLTEGFVNVYGTRWRLEREIVFGQPGNVRGYVLRVLAHLKRQGWGSPGGTSWATDVTVRPRRGAGAAHYSPATGEIALPSPEKGGRWALRELVVLHEVAHHLHACGVTPGPGGGPVPLPGDDGGAHGPRFRAIFLALLRDCGHGNAAGLLRIAYAEELAASAGGTSGDGGLALATRSPAGPASRTKQHRDRLALIADLLARAGCSDSQAERELATARAQREATRLGIDLAEAAHLAAARGQAPEPEERTVGIGPQRSPGLATLTRLYLVVASVNDVKCFVSAGGALVYAVGMPADLDLTESLYTGLLLQMEQSATAWLDSGAYRGERFFDSRGRPRRADRGVARRSFRAGFTERTRELLSQAAREAREEALDEAFARAPGSARRELTSTAIALRAKATALEEHYRQRARDRQVRGTWRGAASTVSIAGWQAGRDAADTAHATAFPATGATPPPE